MAERGKDTTHRESKQVSTPASVEEPRVEKAAVERPSPRTPGPDRSADDREQEIILESGPLFIHYLFSASKTVQVHDMGNRATQRVLSDLMVPLRKMFASDGGVTLRVTPDFLFINDVRLVMDSHNFGPIMYILEALLDRDVETVELHPDVTPGEIGLFLKLFFADTSDDDIFGTLEKRLVSARITHIKLTQWVERERHLRDHVETERNVRKESNQVFFRSLMLVGEVLRGIEQKRVIQVRKAERLTQQMVDIIQADESILVGLASIKDFDAYTFSHSVNVCVLSLVMADRLHLYKSDIARLGIAALLHDIGKMYVPQSILNKPSKLEGKEWDLMKYHTFFGVKELSRVKSPREVVDGLYVALQHHAHYNGGGYPSKPGGWELHLFTRIVTIADYYDAMTTPRIYKIDPLTPDRALRFILEKSGQIFDPFIAKVFIQAMGIYPVGTVVDLDTGERAVVVRQNESSRFIHRPFVIPIRRDGSIDPRGTLYDLAEKGSSENGYRRSIVRTVYDIEAERGKVKFFTTE